MVRIRTQEDFIEKAVATHGNYYDYSNVVYVKSSQKVDIVCPVHGLFQMTPHQHLEGDGCKLCARTARQAKARERFIERARGVHGQRYDYSKVVYVASNKKLCITCRQHGDFWQTPHGHITLAQNCPKCSAIAGGRKRKGDNNTMKKESTKLKAQQTCLERYGTKTWVEHPDHRKIQRDIVLNSDMLDRMRATCQERYGANTWTQSAEGRAKLSEIMSSESMLERVRNGYLSKYGVEHYMKTEDGREIARRCISTPERRLAIRNAFLEKYGVENALLIPDVRAQILDKQPEIVEKVWATKRRNGTFNTSQPEDSLYWFLCDKFGKEFVMRQHFDSVRYPFHCDFYITYLDLFIELNASWTHGGHWFDKNNPLDVLVLNEWEMRAKQKGSRYYKMAITNWTERDPLKLRTAISNHLNYLVFWDNNLTDALAWLDSI